MISYLTIRKSIRIASSKDAMLQQILLISRARKIVKNMVANGQATPRIWLPEVIFTCPLEPIQLNLTQSAIS
jgi:hypothetical protein